MSFISTVALFFRSLFKNTRMSLKEGSKISYQLEIFLWLGALAFHWSFLTVIVRHLRFFTEPVPFLIQLLEKMDGFFRIEILYDVYKWGLPGVYLSGLVLLAVGWGWGKIFFISRNIWTSSFVLYSAGWSLLLLAVFYWTIDVRGFHKWAFFFQVIGANLMTASTGAGVYHDCHLVDIGDAECGGNIGVVYFIDTLNFQKMVSRSQCAQLF